MNDPLKEAMSYNTTFKLTFAQSIQYLVFCITFLFLYDEVGHQQTSEHIPLMVG